MWLIAVGVIGALAAALVGVLDLLAIPTGTRAFRVALVHMTLNVLVTHRLITTIAAVGRIRTRPFAHTKGSSLMDIAALITWVITALAPTGGEQPYRLNSRGTAWPPS
ncbi:hypothetical protein GCM10018965_021950 [Nonomuraea roseola]